MAAGSLAALRTTGSGGPGPGIGLLPLGFLVLMVLAPLVRLAVEALAGAQAGVFTATVGDAYLRWRVGWSLLQAALTCFVALLVGLPLAWVLARLDFPGRALVLRLLMLPFVVPTLVAALGVLSVWGPRGVLAQWWGLDLQDTPWLLLYGNLFFNLCLVLRAAIEALERVSAARVAAARTLGATPWRAFWRVEWPAILADAFTSASNATALSNFGGGLNLAYPEFWGTVMKPEYNKMFLGQTTPEQLVQTLVAATQAHWAANP